MLFAAPSAMDGNHSVSRNRGHRFEYSCDNLKVSPGPAMRGSDDPFVFRNLMISVSQLHVRISRMPVPDDIDTLVVIEPESFSVTKSLKESQCLVATKTSGDSLESQRSFAGQKLE